MTTAPERPPSLYTIGLIRFLVGGLLFLALLQNEPDLALVCLVILGLVELARFWSRTGRNRFDLTVDADRRRLFPGESFVLKIRAENRKLLPVWIQAGIHIPDMPGAPGFNGPPVLNAALLWRQSAALAWTLTAPRRGVYRLGTRQVRIGDLPGFFPQQVRSDTELEIIVFPRRRSVPPLSLFRRELHGEPCRVGPVEDPVYLLGTRDYQPDRPARFIHWKASARHQRWQEKLFEPAAQPRIVLALDVAGFERHTAADAFEDTLEIIGALAGQWFRRGVHVGFVSNGAVTGRNAAVLPAAGDSKQAGALLEMLARLQMKSGGRITEHVSQRHFKRPGLTLVFCGFDFDPEAAALKMQWARNRQPAVFLVHQGAPATTPHKGPLNGAIYGLPGLDAPVEAER